MPIPGVRAQTAEAQACRLFLRRLVTTRGHAALMGYQPTIQPTERSNKEPTVKKFAVALVALSCIAATASLAEAGRVPSPGIDTTRCEAYSSVTYFERFFGGEIATVSIAGDGDTDLDLFVYDMLGRLVGQGIGLTDRETVSFYVPGNQIQTYRIVVRNLGGVWNRFTMRTN
jgi:hypothetical protein